MMDALDALDAWKKEFLGEIRRKAESLRCAAGCLIDSTMFNRHTLSTFVSARTTAREYIAAASRLEALADSWELRGVPAGFREKMAEVSELRPATIRDEDMTAGLLSCLL